MKYSIYKIIALSGLIILSTSCELVEVDRVVDPNSPSTAGVLENASAGELQDLVAGLESVHRDYNNAPSDWWSLTGTISRELYYINTSDPSFADDWLQLPERSADAEDNTNFFVDASGYEAPYGAIRHANLLIESVENSEQITDAQKNGYYGFANTIKAYQFQMPLMHQYENGIRVDVSFSEPLNPGGYLSYGDALEEIRGILDNAATQLDNASEFNFELTEGFDGFDTPAAMLEVNRAIAARFAIYAGEEQAALDALDDSFLNLDPGQGEAGLMAGPAHTFAGGGGQFNPYFFLSDADENLLIVPSPNLIDDAEAGDLRIDNKFEQRTNPATTPDISGLTAEYQTAAYPTATSNMPFIRNEELILIYAEALALRDQGTDLADAVDAINIIRNTWGLSDFASTNQEEIIDQILYERKYSLWGEGHRWVDMRRYERLDEIDTSIDGGRVATQIAQPQTEIDWEDFSN